MSARRKTLARGDRNDGDEHIAIQEALDGKVVDWMEKVTDEEYLAAPASE
jgi:hypothetical protein